MRQITITEYGGPEVLRVTEAPDPTPGPGEIRVSVSAAGLNFADVSARMGLYPDAPKPPMVVGYEASGVVDRLGDGVTGFEVGERVLVLSRFGGQSSSVVVPMSQAVVIPDELDLVAAAAIPVNYLTAYLMLVRLAALRPGDSVLIHAAAGGVGIAAIQLCRTLGVTTYGTASASKHEAVRALGLDHPIDYRNQDFAAEVLRLTGGRGVDVILDAVGGSTSRKNYKLLAPLGRLFHFGASSASKDGRRKILNVVKSLGAFPVYHPIQLMNANKAVYGINLGHLWDEQEMLREILDELLEMWQQGVIEPVIDSIHPFDQVAAAHDRLESAKNVGKVLLVPQPL